MSSNKASRNPYEIQVNTKLVRNLASMKLLASRRNPYEIQVNTKKENSFLISAKVKGVPS